MLAGFGYTPEATPDVPLFPGARGTGIQIDRRMGRDVREGRASLTDRTSQAITHLLRTAVAQAEIGDPTPYSSHSLRATYTTLSYAAGVPESKIAEVTGHKSLTVLRGYDRTAPEQIAQADYLGG